jgi:ariadne-1
MHLVHSGINSPSMNALKSGIRMMQAEEIRPEMNVLCKDVCEVLGISLSAASVLLNAFHWSKETLLERYMNDSDQILKKSGVYNRCMNGTPNSTMNATGTRTCFICFDETNQMFSMPCGHAFCLDCWNAFCTNAVDDGPSCVITTCPDASCTEIVTDDEFVKALGTTSPSYIKFKNFQLRSFVESNPYTRWCPGRGCERIAYALSPAAMELEGSVAKCDTCTTKFCLVCGEEPHAPATCKALMKWNEKCRNESETANWILANTKSCPNCLSRIEKNQGCNHMSCQKCKHEFCWICMGCWKDHGSNTGGYYKCNKFDSEDGMDNANDMSDAGRAKRELDRYLHFYSRYHAHSEAQNFASKQLKATELRMIQLQESSNGSNLRWSDVEFLKAANEQLVECRRVLKYTYVFSYYMDYPHNPSTAQPTTTSSSSAKSKNSTSKQQPVLETTSNIMIHGNAITTNALQRERFEYHQEMLERFTENLSELSEKPIHEMDRTDVVNQTRVVDLFMKNILKYVEDGMDDA